LEKEGLKYTDESDADYSVFYWYTSTPELPLLSEELSHSPEAFRTKFNHSMEMSLSKKGEAGTTLWSGHASLPFSQVSDIGPSIVVLASMLTSKFPDVEYRYESPKK